VRSQDHVFQTTQLRLEWIAASEGDKVQKVINEMTETVRRLGPLDLEPKAWKLIRKTRIELPEAPQIALGGVS
jgi:hypothetical protein